MGPPTVAALGLLLTALTQLPAATDLQDGWRFELGDDPSWAAPHFEDRDWRTVPLTGVPSSPSFLWLRHRVTLPAAEASPDGGPTPVGLRLAALAACEIFWDGQRIGSNGRPGATRSTEVPGQIDTRIYLSGALLTPGTHLLALRCSTHHRGFAARVGFYWVALGPWDELTRADRLYAALVIGSWSAMVLIGLFHAVAFALDRRRTLDGLLALLALATALLLTAEGWRTLFGYSYDRHLVRLRTVAALTWGVSVLMPVFLAHLFALSRRGWLWGAAAAIAVVPIGLAPSFDSQSAAMLGLGLAISALLCGRALVGQQRGALLASVAVGASLLGLVADPFRFIDQYLFLALDGLLLAFLLTHTVESRRERRRRQAAELRSTRLENELLKRHLQPHFLMNSLAALEAWIDEDPVAAGELVQALAAELRLLGEVSTCKAIPLERELALCRYHLTVMGRRHDRIYHLDATGVDLRQEVPPAIFHTLVENALTHQRHALPRVELRLRQESAGARRRYVFEAPLGLDHDTPRTPGTGTGLRYVRARLEEISPGSWSLQDGPACAATGSGREAVWRTVIELSGEPTGDGDAGAAR